MPKGKRNPKNEEQVEEEVVEDEVALDVAELAAVGATDVAALAQQAEDKGTALLLSLIADLKRQVEDVSRVQKVDSTLPPPPPPRNEHRHIMVWVNPWNMVRIEVPEDYDGEGADGKAVKGFQNHENTLGNLLRR